MANRLAGETSPYLQQHADNPVDWYPWGEEALLRATRDDKPILLSIGYSACHWCHVMAHESFEDAHIAAVMNELYVNIKVDREERPDIDQIYQAAHALLTRRGGGWPLTMFLTPRQEPFFGGTYFPKTSRYGLPGFGDLLPRIAAAYREQGSAIAEQNARLREAFALTDTRALDAPNALPASALDHAFRSLAKSFDTVHGGFGRAPKFPHATELDFCLRYYAAEEQHEALDIVRVTLRNMAEGGIHDQLGGGFCRYSVDAEWTIPHFEKMLYDNATLLALYADAWRATGEMSFARSARDIVGWLLAEMRAPEGGFYSSIDADSEHEEGKFYVWTDHEVKNSLEPDEFDVASRHWGLDRPPNFERAGWNLRVAVPLEDVARTLGISLADATTQLERARLKLLSVRSLRIRPGRDDKVLTSWNGLMIAALARAARIFDEPEWLIAAQQAADFVRATLWREGQLLATYKDGRAHLNAYLDDHAFLLAATVELMQSDFRAKDLAWATELAQALLNRFEDRERGGFFFTSHDHETLIHRPKQGGDNSIPSGNGVAAQALITLGHWLGESRYLEAAERTVRAFAEDLAAQPAGFASLLVAMKECLRPPTSVVLTGDATICAEWKRALDHIYRPTVRVLDISRQPDAPLALTKPISLGKNDAMLPSAWVCRGSSCLPPIGSLDELESVLNRGQ